MIENAVEDLAGEASAGRRDFTKSLQSHNHLKQNINNSIQLENDQEPFVA